MALPKYFPFMHGVYYVKAGISALSKDHGNGAIDGQVFQIDEQFDAYRRVKRRAKNSQCLFRDNFDVNTRMAIECWATQRLSQEYPGRLNALRPFELGLDGLSMFIQEDIAVLQLDKRGGNRLSFLHVCMPSGWAPEEKIGRPFDEVHAPVPHIEPLSAKQDSIARLMVNATKGAVRFAWTITDDPALNHHPHRDRSIDHPTPLPDHPAGEPLLRVERQVIWGFPKRRAALFLIRTYLYPFESLASPVRSALSLAVSGMSDASLRYKNMDRGLILERLA